MNLNPLNLIKNKAFKEELWTEVKKINWKNVNKESSKHFILTVVGDDLTFESFTADLESSTYDFLGLRRTASHPLTAKAQSMYQQVPIDDYTSYKHIIRNSTIIIVDQRFLHRIDLPLKQITILTLDDVAGVYEDILIGHPEYEQALCFNYPAFRSHSARKLITGVSLQNAAWAGGTSLPNTIPGLHQLLLAPMEAASDFTVLTLNEVRMTFILAGISGRLTNPAKLLPEIMILLTGAKGAELLATQTIGKVPAGAGVALKASIAFAFTYAIGEAVYLNLNYGIKISRKAIIERMEDLKSYAKKMTLDKFTPKPKD